jgi:hypothetical protein
MGERKDAIPLRRKRALKIRAAFALAVFLAFVAYYLGVFGGTGAATHSNADPAYARTVRGGGADVADVPQVDPLMYLVNLVHSLVPHSTLLLRPARSLD